MLLPYIPHTSLPLHSASLHLILISCKPHNLLCHPQSCRQYDNPSTWPELMVGAALKVYASLGANDEDIRQRVIKTDVLMNTIVTSLSAASPPVQLAAVRCLHSLSRSVHTLRTTLQVRL
ncbi:Armadillo repeat-containing protein 8 [Portunus trituberculatus]|uniref:Armadillo repeat-containing protein 8 n=1 Tax=Portunus trituberculatus TaxID=210409 RepID=A0A5B7K781_PORTR|nr:Armadillo repeat-containing protein 8 [Portunus trituberculatus]